MGEERGKKNMPQETKDFAPQILKQVLVKKCILYTSKYCIDWRKLWNLQELEIVMGEQHISFTTAKIGSLIDVNQCK